MAEDAAQTHQNPAAEYLAAYYVDLKAHGFSGEQAFALVMQEAKEPTGVYVSDAARERVHDPFGKAAMAAAREAAEKLEANERFKRDWERHHKRESASSETAAGPADE